MLQMTRRAKSLNLEALLSAIASAALLAACGGGSGGGGSPAGGVAVSSQASSSLVSSAASSLSSASASAASSSTSGLACTPAIAPTPGLQRLLALGVTCAAQTLGYAEYVPPTYASVSSWPLIIAFHGDGESGMGGSADIGKVDNNGLPKEVNDNSWDATHRFIVLSPQMNGTTRTAINVHNFIQFAKANYKVDTMRIYLTGLSGGGGPLYRYLDAYAGGEVAAVVPISAVYSFNNAAACGWKHIPVWFFHGSADSTVTSNNSKIAFDNLNACTPAPVVAPRFTEFTGVSHDGWTRTYDLTGMNTAVQSGRTIYSQSIYDWLLQYQR